ncbi:putative aspartate aminotransferase, cytoplasmic 2 [Pteropus vampyrus]|uniref:Putative aspartate aminotransferase, cytoplasmic 2 n=1 Tax=Pteropus vampyrus TaxID=132908 RepID=A0A6P3QZB3_PTEVA|nr:putative aspartate aminotransferase, cytoplasmic 2 [Pteropus vampyrus]
MTTLSVFMDVPLVQKLEGGLLKTYKQDDYPNKMFLAYRVCMTSEGRPWVSSVVHKLRLQIAQDPSLNYEYMPAMGMKSFIQASLELLFGKYSQVIVENRVGGVHTVGDSGAFQLGAQFLKTWRCNSQTVYIISSQKELHGLVFQDMGFTVYEYSFWDSKQLCMNPNMLLDVLEQAPHGCIFVIGNIGNCKLTRYQWAKLMGTMKSKQIFPFFDIPYQGLSTGDLEEDTKFLHYFVSGGFEFFCSQSLSRNFGIYDEGVGILVVVALNNQLLLCALSQLMNFAQALWLTPPTTGARIITSILCNPALHKAWKQSLKGVVENIMLIKEKVKEKLRLLGTPGSWDHITDQNGTHSYLGLNTKQVEYLVKKKHIYIPKNGRINFTCINACNIDYITESIHEAVLFTKGSERRFQNKGQVSLRGLQAASTQTLRIRLFGSGLTVRFPPVTVDRRPTWTQLADVDLASPDFF